MQKITIKMPKNLRKMPKINAQRPFWPGISTVWGKLSTITVITVFRISVIIITLRLYVWVSRVTSDEMRQLDFKPSSSSASYTNHLHCRVQKSNKKKQKKNSTKFSNSWISNHHLLRPPPLTTCTGTAEYPKNAIIHLYTFKCILSINT